MRVEYGIFARQYAKYKDEYETAALRVLRSGWYILGNELKTFEQKYAQFMGIKHCVGVNSGLDALVLAIRALGLGQGDEIIVQANTFIASVLAITESGATPVFADVDDYFGLNSLNLENMITPNTKAIMPVHLYGQPCKMDAIMDVAREHKLYVIEDCAQAHGATYNGKLVGTFGDIGCFSFYPTKPIGALGDAGSIVTNNDGLFEKLNMLRNYGSKTKYKHEIIGVNTRLDELQAALLSVSLNHVHEGNDERKAIAKRYLSEINNPAIVLPKKRPNVEHIYHVFAVMCQRREKLYNYLTQHDIYTQIHYPIPCHLAPCYSYLNHKVGEFPVSELFANEELSLPIYVGMPDDEVSYVIYTINNYQNI